MQALQKKQKTWALLLLGALLGLAAFLCLYGTAPLDPANDAWIWYGYDETDNTAFGGVIGAVVGLLGGPVGVLLGAGIGLVAGMAMDDKDVDDDDSLMEYCASELAPGATALVMLTKEDNEDALDAQFDETCVIYRWDADEVNAEVERAEALSDTLAAETRKQLREARKEARKARREARNDN